MRSYRFLTIPFAVALGAAPATAQWSHHGLAGAEIWEISLNGSSLYAATENGLFRSELHESGLTWTSVGLDGRNVRTFEVLGDGMLIASVDVSDDDIINDQQLYRTADDGATWQAVAHHLKSDAPDDYFEVIRALPGQADVLLAGGYATLVISHDAGTSWEPASGSWDGMGMATHFITVDPLDPGVIWAGGESPIFWPFLLHSSDGGDSWRIINLDLGGDNAVYDMAIDPRNTDVMYVGVEGSVLKSSDGGETWHSVLESPTYEYFLGLDLSPANPSRVYAAGIPRNLEPVLTLHISDDGGATWTTYTHDALQHGSGVVSLAVRHADSRDVVYLATRREGVYAFEASVPTGSPDDTPHHAFVLAPNYPNPIRSTSRFRVVTSVPSHVTLRIFDLLGRQVASLLDGPLPAGSYEVDWDAHRLPSGSYVCRLESGGFSAARSVVVVR